jgi:hypothetical protein
MTTYLQDATSSEYITLDPNSRLLNYISSQFTSKSNVHPQHLLGSSKLTSNSQVNNSNSFRQNRQIKVIVRGNEHKNAGKLSSFSQEQSSNQVKDSENQQIQIQLPTVPEATLIVDETVKNVPSVNDFVSNLIDKVSTSSAEKDIMTAIDSTMKEVIAKMSHIEKHYLETSDVIEKQTQRETEAMATLGVLNTYAISTVPCLWRATKVEQIDSK